MKYMIRVILSLIIIAGGIPIAMASNITFSGNLVMPGCKLESVEVDFGDVELTGIYPSAEGSFSKQVNIPISGCEPGTKIYGYFSGSITNGNPLLLDTSMVAGRIFIGGQNMSGGTVVEYVNWNNKQTTMVVQPDKTLKLKFWPIYNPLNGEKPTAGAFTATAQLTIKVV